MFSPTKLSADPRNSDLELIIDIHRYKRPKGSRIEQMFVDTFLNPLGVKADKWGNIHKIILPEGASDDTHAEVIWSSHTDTVHNEEGFQRIVCDANGTITVRKGEKSNCLGADDGAGVWLMMEMIKARIPGWYIFHYGEEKGCEGSTKLAQNHPELFKHVKYAVAFDRRNNGDVITKMGGKEVCSDAFADSLIAQLPEGYKKEPHGSRTDVALYRGLVPECTNISVGYLAPHMATESLDTHHLIRLRDSLLKIDVSKLVVKRDHKAPDPVTTYPARGSHYGGTYNYNEYKESRPRAFYQLFKDCPTLCASMMRAAGVDFDTFLSMALKHQAEAKPVGMYTALDKELIAPAGWVDPMAEKAADPATTDVVKADPPKDEAKANTPKADAPKTDANTTTNPVALEPIKGSAGATNVTPLHTGNPSVPRPGATRTGATEGTKH